MEQLPVSHQECEIPIPLNSTYGGHMIHNHIVIPSSSPSNGQTSDLSNNFKKVVKYKECLKNHAASMGGNATDGCGEFMPSGEEGTIEALNCSACNCHRNFHRKDVEGDPSSCDNYSLHPSRIGGRLLLGHHQHNHRGYFGQDGLLSSRTMPPQHHQMIMSYNMGSLPSESDEQEEVGGVRPNHMMVVKKRHRTKFTSEQKEKMLSFAEKVGWKIQKHEESLVQQICHEIGVKRRVLKVWMHNNKHNFGKKSIVNQADVPSNTV